MSADVLLEAEGVAAGFQMQSFRSAEGRWVPMEDGAARRVWLPRKAAEDAIHKCLEWTGLICIPAMRVVDLASGDVVWQDRWSDGGDGHLDVIVPDWAAPIYDQVRAEFRAEAERERELIAGGVTTELGAAVDEAIRGLRESVRMPDDGALFTMGDFDD